MGLNENGNANDDLSPPGRGAAEASIDGGLSMKNGNCSTTTALVDGSNHDVTRVPDVVNSFAKSFDPAADDAVAGTAIVDVSMGESVVVVAMVARVVVGSAAAVVGTIDVVDSARVVVVPMVATFVVVVVVTVVVTFKAVEVKPKQVPE